MMDLREQIVNRLFSQDLLANSGKSILAAMLEKGFRLIGFYIAVYPVRIMVGEIAQTPAQK